MRYPTAVPLLIIGEFIILGAVILLQADTSAPPLYTGLLLFLLCSVVLVTVLFLQFQQKKSSQIITAELAEERNIRRDLQRQFEQAIEQRTFELQRVNGALHREIAERTQAEEEVRELQKQLTLILDSAGEGILGLDNRGKVMFINRAALLMLGWEMDDLIGHGHHELIHHTYPDGSIHPVEECPIYMAYRDGQVHFKSDDVFWCKNGTNFPVEYVSTPIRDRGMLTGAVVVFRDMNTFK